MKPLLLLVLLAPLSSPPAAALAQELDREALADAVYGLLDKKRIPGAVVGVVLGDELVFQEGYGDADVENEVPMEPGTLGQIGSATKSMTATLLGMLRDAGKLSFDDRLDAHWPDEHPLPGPIAALTLRQILTHTSGLPRDAVNRRNLPDSPSVPYPYSRAELLEGLARTELDFEPGARWSYSNVGYAILGHVVEHVAGATYEDLLRARLFEPLGMTSSGIHPTAAHEQRLARHYWARDDPPVARDRYRWGEVASHGGVYSSVPDLARYLLWWMGTDEELGLSVATRLEMRTAAMPLAEGSDDSMGLGWFVFDLGGVPLISHGGEVDGQSSMIAWVPDRDVAVVVLANSGRDAADAIAKQVLRQLSDAVR